mgnify:FL=1
MSVLALICHVPLMVSYQPDVVSFTADRSGRGSMGYAEMQAEFRDDVVIIRNNVYTAVIDKNLQVSLTLLGDTTTTGTCRIS